MGKLSRDEVRALEAVERGGAFADTLTPRRRHELLLGLVTRGLVKPPRHYFAGFTLTAAGFEALAEARR